MTMLPTSEAEVAWVNASGENADKIAPAVDKVARELANWMHGARRPTNAPSIFNRTAYIAPENPYNQMDMARNAVENDDVVSGVADVTEGLMFQDIKWESAESDEADIFNQIAADLNLDEFVRQWHREEFTYSQVVVGVWWGRRTYTVRNKTDSGKRSKKKYSIHCPVALTFLDPQKVVPLQPGPFGQDRLAWQATKDEYAASAASPDGLYQSDPVLATFTTGPVEVSKSEETYLSSLGIKTDRLLGLNPAFVFRYCRTKMHYQRFAPLRLKSVFPLLDLKQQLLESDRVTLVGAINFIILVKQGSKEEPAMPEELANLKENFKIVAKLPVIIGDHRLSIEIITPSQEHTIDPTKYDTLDRRIIGRCLGALAIASSGQRNESTLTIARGVARLLESRRKMMKRVLERELARAVVEHPGNAGLFKEEPNLIFSPRNVQLDNDAAITQAILQLRQMNELSRESMLEYFQFDQLTEALRREFEESSGLDAIFKTRVPFSSPNDQGSQDNGGQGGDQQGNGQQAEGTGETPMVSGKRGGRPKGGGKSPNSPQGRAGNRTGNGNPSTGGN